MTRTTQRTSRPSKFFRRSDAPAPPRLAATLATLGLFGVTAWADGPAAPPLPNFPGQKPMKTVPKTSPPSPAPQAPASPAASPPQAPSEPPGKEPSGATPASPATLPGTDPSAPAFTPSVGANGGTANGSSLLGSWGKDLTISGGYGLHYRANSLSGGELASADYANEYGNAFYDGRELGPLQQTMDLTIQGKVFNAFSVNARLSNARYGNYFNQSFGFNYKSKGTSVDIGNINAALSGNSLVSFSRSLQGLMFSRDFGGGMRFSGIASLTKAATQRGAFQGQGVTGPYYLNSSSIVEGTERLRLNGRDLKPGPPADGGDYTIDYLTGQVTFTEIILPEWTVEYSYESYNYNTTAGLLTGGRLDFKLGSNSFGITMLQQKSKGGGRDGDVTEYFPVTGIITDRYTLRNPIQPGTTVEVKWFEQLLVENVDYRLNRELHFIELRNPLPPDTSATGIASLRVKYRPVRASAVGGDRSVMGLNGNFLLGNAGNVAVEFGQSQSPDGTSSGTATSVTATLRSRGSGDRNQWNLTTSWRDIGSGFTPLDTYSNAFLRAEKGLNATFSFSPNQYVGFTSSFTNSRIAQPNYGGVFGGTTGGTTGQTQGMVWTTNQNLNAGLNLSFPNWPTLTLNHTQISQGSGGTRSSFVTDSLNLSWQKGILGLSAELGRTAARGRTVFGTGYGTTPTGGGTLIGGIENGSGLLSTNDSSSTTARLSLSLTPASWISLTSNLGVARTRYGSASGSSTSASDANARDVTVGLTLNPLSNLTIQANFSDTSNGQSTAQFYNPGTGTGTGTGNSFVPTGILGQRTRTTQLSLQYSPFRNLSLNFDTNRQLSLIPGYDNTESATTQIGFSYTPFNKFFFSGSLIDQNVTYVGNVGDSSNRSYTFTNTVGPFGKFSFTSSLQRMNTGSAIFSSYSGATGAIPGVGDGVNPVSAGSLSLLQRQNLTILSTRLDYDLGGGRSLFLQWQALDTRTPLFASDTPTTGNYRIAANTQRSVGTVGLEMKLTQILGLRMDMNLIRLTDRDDARYSYSGRMMNMDVSARF